MIPRYGCGMSFRCVSVLFGQQRAQAAAAAVQQQQQLSSTAARLLLGLERLAAAGGRERSRSV
jgi:hypothetical protein